MQQIQSLPGKDGCCKRTECEACIKLTLFVGEEDREHSEDSPVFCFLDLVCDVQTREEENKNNYYLLLLYLDFSCRNYLGAMSYSMW